MGRVPRVSLAYGAIFAIAGVLLSFGLTAVGLQSMILVLEAGFILVGPMIAACLYETSRRLEKGEPVSLASTLRAGFFERGQLAYMEKCFQKGRDISLDFPCKGSMCSGDGQTD
jgi:hypothetical protein